MVPGTKGGRPACVEVTMPGDSNSLHYSSSDAVGQETDCCQLSSMAARKSLVLAEAGPSLERGWHGRKTRVKSEAFLNLVLALSLGQVTSPLWTPLGPSA